MSAPVPPIAASPAAEGDPASGSRRPLLVPLASAALLAACSTTAPCREEPALRTAFLGACLLLLLGCAGLTAAPSRRRLTIAVSIRPQHWLQACAHLSIFWYWGREWPPVSDYAWLIAAQVVFAYGCEALLSLARRGTLSLGFGPFPIVFSTNLFLWFKPPWFHYQLGLIALGLVAKELIRWERDGTSTHVFNPSSFPLAVASLILLATGTTEHTLGREIASTLFYPRHIYPFLFLVALPGQLLFGVTTMTLPAVVTVFGWSTLYHAVTGSWFFVDAHIPIAVFLGMHLLFTDPSTSPRSEPGRICFGVLYGAGVLVTSWLLLDVFHTFGFYDKLLPVPLCNLSVRAIDRGVAALTRRWPWLDTTRLGPPPGTRARNLRFMAAWAVIFALFSSTGNLGDAHPGSRLPSWLDACERGLRGGCANLAVLEGNLCLRRQVGWACNELGVLVAQGRATSAAEPPDLFARACDDGMAAGCDNRRLFAEGERSRLSRVPPRVEEYPALVQSKGIARPDSEAGLRRIACDQGWRDACARLAVEPR